MKRPLHSRASRVARVRRRQAAWQRLCLSAVAAAVAASAGAGPALLRNMPGECAQPGGSCDCQSRQVSAGCVKVAVDLGGTTPWRRELTLEEGNGETAARLLALLAPGARSRSELASELGISSQPWLSNTYLKPLMAQGYIAQTMPGKPKLPLQRYMLLRKGKDILA